MSFLDRLPILSFRKESAKSEYFFLLNIETHTIEVAVWGVEGNKLIIVNLSKISYKDEKDLSETANQLLDEVLEDFEPEPTKILFGVPDSWLIDDSLKEEHLKGLRKLVKDLDITPMAYVSTAHAISHLLQKQQGIPLTAILINVDDPLVVSVVKAGKVIGSRTVKRAEEVGEDVEKALLNFTEVEVLPSKIFLYSLSEDDEGLNKLKEELLSFPWMQNLPFLHLPKIEILSPVVTTSSVALAGATELNPAVSFSEKDLSYLSQKFITPPAKTHRAHDDLVIPYENEDQPKHKDKSPQAKGEKPERSGKAGFISGDIEDMETEEESLYEQELEGDNFARPHAALTPKRSDIVVEDDSFLTTPYHRQSSLTLGEFARQRLKAMLMMLLIPFILVILAAAGYIFIPKAKVTIYVDPRILEKEAQVIVDPTITEVDQPHNKIPGKTVETTLTSIEKGVATGKKPIGDPAKGKVIIYNKTDAEKTISQGTILVSNQGIKFKLNTSVTVASQSATTGPDKSTIIQPGKSSPIDATALDIGPDGNLPAGADLSISGFPQSQFISTVDTAFSGGTSKEVTVVTSEDQKKLLALATSNLRKKAKDELQSKLSGDSRILEEGLAENITKSTYNKNINDQATDFSLSLAVKYKGTVYSDNDLKMMIAKLVETTIPEGYKLNLSETETQADVARLDKDGKLIFAAKFRAKLTPKLNEEEIKQKIKGKTPGEVAFVVKGIDSVVSSEIEIVPSLPGPLQRLPFLQKNISVIISTK